MVKGIRIRKYCFYFKNGERRKGTYRKCDMREEVEKKEVLETREGHIIMLDEVTYIKCIGEEELEI